MIGKNIANLRKKHKMTQIEFAERVHVTQGAVSQWETGRTNPDTYQLIQIAQIFGVDVNYLTNGQTQSSITFPGTLKPADIVYDRPLDAARIKAAAGDSESMIQLENRHNMHKAIHEKMQELSDEHLKQAYEYVQFLKKLEEK